MPQLTAKQQKLPEGLKRAILAKKGKSAKKAPPKPKMSPRVRKAPKPNY